MGLVSRKFLPEVRRYKETSVRCVLLSLGRSGLSLGRSSSSHTRTLSRNQKSKDIIHIKYSSSTSNLLYHTFFRIRVLYKR